MIHGLRLGLASALVGLAAAAHAAPFAYVPHDSGVTVIDVADPQATQQVAIRQGPFTGVAARPGDTRAYVLSAPAILFVEVRTQRELLEMQAGGAYFMAIERDGPKAVVLEEPCLTGSCVPGVQAWVRLIDTESRGDLAVFSLATHASQAVFNTVGSRIYVSDDGANTVHVYDTQNPSELPGINVGSASRGLVVHPAMNRLYVVLPVLNAVRVVNLEDNTIVATIPVGASPTGIVSDLQGARMYVTNTAGNSVSVIDTASNTVIATIPVGASPQGIDMTPDGGAVYVVNTGANSVSFISTNSFTVVGGVSVGNAPRVAGRFIGGPSHLASTSPGILTGLFWNPAESGWGIHLTQRDNTLFAAWFTYGGEGAPRWYAASNCAMVTPLPCPTCVEGAICNSGITESRGPDILSDVFNPANVSRGNVGNLRLRFDDADNATMTYDANGYARTVRITRQLFSSGLRPGPDYSDLWWNPRESGWGLGITQQGYVMFLTWFVYDRPGAPVWYVASRCEVFETGDGCRGRLYRVTGPQGPNTSQGTFEANRVAVEDVGTIELTFAGGDNGEMNYVLHGVAGRKTITRQLF